MDPIIGNSLAIRNVMETVKKVAATEANVLILGENGTGKELVAREIHRQSLRAAESFVSVDMAAITETLFESEMFGHEKGAFTDAREDRTGRFEIASGGTLFLDEIGNLSMPLQAKLLNALQDREIKRVGSESSIKIDIRLVSATNRNLDEMVSHNTFRDDLLYRINTIQINLPTLRERQDDIPILADYFLKKYEKKYRKSPIVMKGDAYDKLVSHSWPGNIRELKHTMEKAVILCDSGTLSTDDFYFGASQMMKSKEEDSMKLSVVEKNLIEKVLDQTHGNMSQAAKLLDISRTTLYSKIKKYDL
jgi:transcriptional regulator with PAS, ATPase and Fis domain